MIQVPIHIQLFFFDQDENKIKDAEKQFPKKVFKAKDMIIYVDFIHTKPDPLKARVNTWISAANCAGEMSEGIDEWYTTTFPWLAPKVKRDIEKKSGKITSTGKPNLPVGSALWVTDGLKNSEESCFVISPIQAPGQADITATNNVYHAFYAAMSLLFSHTLQTGANTLSVGCPLFGVSNGCMTAVESAKQMNEALRVAFRYGKQYQLSFDNTSLVKFAVKQDL